MTVITYALYIAAAITRNICFLRALLLP